jgi:hypothetical protein
MKDLNDIFTTVIDLPYDMRVEFKPAAKEHGEGVVRAVYLLRLADGSSVPAGEQRVSVELLRVVAKDSLRLIFSSHAEMLINKLSQ